MINLPTLPNLRFIAKKTIRADLFRKIQRIKDKEEQSRLYQYSIKSAIEMKYAELKDSVEKMDKEKGEGFIPLTKVYLLGYKIHYMNTTFHRRDFKTVDNLFKEIEKGVKNGTF